MADFERDSFIVYSSFYKAIKKLDREDQGVVWSAICEYALTRNEIELEGVPSIIFDLIKPQLEANFKKYLNGKKAKQKQNRSKTEANESKTEGNVNVNVNENVNENVITNSNKVIYKIDQLAQELINSHSWKENTIRRLNQQFVIDPARMDNNIRIFVEELKAQGVEHKEITEAKKHCLNFIRKHLTKKTAAV